MYAVHAIGKNTNFDLVYQIHPVWLHFKKVHIYFQLLFNSIHSNIGIVLHENVAINDKNSQNSEINLINCIKISFRLVNQHTD